MCVVGRNLWICTGGNTNAGTVVIYDLDTKAIKVKVQGWEEGRREEGGWEGGERGVGSPRLQGWSSLLP